MKFIPILFVLEIFVGVMMTRYFGFLNTVLVYLVPTFLGLTFFTFQNQMIWMQFQKQMATGKTPDTQILDLVAKFAGTIMMIIPSLILRSLALCLLLPLTRFFLVKVGQVWVAQKIAKGSFQFFSSRQDFGGRQHNFRYYNEERDAKVIDIEALPLPDDKKPN